MADPFALPSDYTDRGYDASKFEPTVLAARLAAASRHVRARVRGVDARVESGALDGDLVADIVCAMVARTVPVQNLEGVHTYQTSVGPFQDSYRMANASGDLYLTKGERTALRGGQRAGSVDPSWRGDESSSA